MRKKIAWISSAATAGGLLVAGFAVAASPGTGHAPAHAVLAANTASSPAVNLHNCPTLAEGYQGGCVNQLQTELNSIDNAGLPLDGIFGPQTQQAVITFQQQNGVSPADGIVGPLTKAALDNPAPAATTTPRASDSTTSPPSVNLDNCPTLAEGYHGGCVNQLQTELNTDENANLPVDGTFGLATQAAVVAFQQAHGVVPADGIVGPQTKAALDNPDPATTTTPGATDAPATTTTPGSPQPARPDCSQNATQGPPSASIPPQQQNYFHCPQPPVGGIKINGACLVGLGATGLGALAGIPEGPPGIAAGGSLALSAVGTALAC